MRKFERFKSNAPIPQRATNGSAGYDIRTGETAILKPMECKYIDTGLRVKMNPDEYLMIVARSSLFKKFHCIIPGSLGIIDYDYYNNKDNGGHFKIVLLNLSTTETVTIPYGTAVVQGIFCKYGITDDDNPVLTIRNGGFGSTDKEVNA